MVSARSSVFTQNLDARRPGSYQKLISFHLRIRPILGGNVMNCQEASYSRLHVSQVGKGKA